MVKPARPLLALFLAAAALACGEDRSAPSSPTPPIPEPNRETSALSILGAPATLHIGQTAQLRAMAQYIDGAGFVDVTQQASWQSSNDQACRVSAGALTSAAAGTATVSAQFGGRSATATVSCGYVITATVHENPPTLNVMLPDARVEVVGGALDGKTFLTDAQGRVSLPPIGEAGFWLYFKKQGYDDLRYEIFELPRQSDLDILLMPEPDVRVELTGPCFGAYNRTTTNFSTHREGRVRVSLRTVRTPGTQIVACTQVHRGVFFPSSLLFCMWADNGQKDGEAVIAPGTYQLDVAALDECPSGASWHLVLDHQR